MRREGGTAAAPPVPVLRIAAVMALSVLFFFLCYYFDNKCTAPAPPASGGSVALTAEFLRTHPAFFLMDGWEIYRGKLLAPEDFGGNSDADSSSVADGSPDVAGSPDAAGSPGTGGSPDAGAAAPPVPDEYVFIGQYGGFEGADFAHPPHGSATYRIRVSLPPELRVYMLELPEIYSAYKVYANGVLLEQFGNPAPEAYAPQTGWATASFAAATSVEIIIAVTDYSHIYSGMVYPPAFGEPAAVSVMLQTRLLLRAAICTLALALAAVFFLSGLFTGRNRLSILYGLLCLCFVGYAGYPVVKTVSRGGLLENMVENLCFVLLLLLACRIQKLLLGGAEKPLRLFAGFCAFVCLCVVLRAAFPTDDMRLLAFYSLLTDACKWAAAAYLTVNAFRRMGVVRETRNEAILTGILVLDCALAMDRVFSLFEPIRLGWFAENAGFVIVLSIGAVLGRGIVRQHHERVELRDRVRYASQLVDMQRAYYPLIAKGVEEARRIRHDARHHLHVIGGFAHAGDNRALEAYLDEYAEGLSRAPLLFHTENDVVDVILQHFAGIATRDGVEFRVEAAIPTDLAVDNADLCAVISNLVENALEACGWLRAARGDSAAGAALDAGVAGAGVASGAGASGGGVPDAGGAGASGGGVPDAGGAGAADAKTPRIKLFVKEVKRNLVIICENSFDGYRDERGGVLYSRKRAGAGIGLASVRAVAEKYGGSLDYETKRGFGAEDAVFSVTVVLPRG